MLVSKTDPHIAKIPQPSLQNSVCVPPFNFFDSPHIWACTRRVLAEIQPHFALRASKMIITHTAKAEPPVSAKPLDSRDSARKLLDAFVALR
jgi:hypothetical protein